MGVIAQVQRQRMLFRHRPQALQHPPVAGCGQHQRGGLQLGYRFA